MWEVQSNNVLMERQSGNGWAGNRRWEGEWDSDVEPETQTESQLRENHFVWFWEGWTEGEEMERAFLLLSTSILQHFPPTIPRDITSLPLQVIFLPFAIIYVAKISHLHTRWCFSSLHTSHWGEFPLMVQWRKRIYSIQVIHIQIWF